MSAFFKRHTQDSQNPIIVYDWITNIFDSLVGVSDEYITTPKSDSNQLAYFTSLESVKTTGSILHKYPKTVTIVGKILLEFRIYYDCIWQIHLLDNFSDSEKISNLFAAVHLSETGLWKSIFKENKKIEILLQDVLNKHSYEKIKYATEIYIHNQISREMKEIVSEIYQESPNLNKEHLKLSLLLFREIAEIIQESGIRLDENDNTNVLNILFEDTENSFNNKLLTRFNLNECEVIEFPPEFYE